MKRQSVNCILILAFIFCSAFASAETVAYRLTKVVSIYDEVTEITNGQKIYVHFSNDKSSFFLSKQDGSRAGWPDQSTGYASGFANQDVSSMINSTISSGTCRSVRDPLDFRFLRDENGVHIYSVTRPLLAITYGTYRSIYVTGNVTDFAKFNRDFSGINVFVDKEKGMYGIYPFVGFPGYDISTVKMFVFRKVEAPNVSGTDFIE